MERRLELFPDTAQIVAGDDGRAALTIGGCNLAALAAAYGTPLYLFDEATLDARVQAYRDALAAHYPAEAAITLAGKALLLKASAQWAARRGLWLDCTGAGELAIAAAADFPGEQLLVHGVNKSDEDLHASLESVAVIVVDNLTELQRLLAMATAGDTPLPALWLRVRPGVAVDTHAFRQTGQSDSKFGMDPSEVRSALALCSAAGQTVEGVHFHQGSHFHNVQPIAPGLETVLELIAQIHAETGWVPQVLSPGGGWGVPYHEDDLPHPSIEDYVRFVAEALVAGCAARALPLPRLQLEPGRSIVAQAGVALYRVGAIKQSGARRWLLLDGGLADNPRPALYSARYSALPVLEPTRAAVGAASLAGPYCESGDVLIHDLPLPAIAEGELLAVPVSGAYHLNMASNYNGARRPAVLWLRSGHAQLVQRRETVDDLLRRDMGLDA
jgi:diaminopimelate decarboxylase